MSEPLAADSPPERAGAAKADPETFVLRARPERVARFKRSIIVIITACAVVGIVLAVWLALKPTSFHLARDVDTSSEPAKAPGETLNELPSTYAQAPKLGPPLPGDLGRPILEHQRAIATAAPEMRDERQRAQQAERERMAAQARSARESAVLASVGKGTAAADDLVSAKAAPAASPAMAESNSANTQGRKGEFVAALDKGGDVNPHRIEAAASRYLLSAGHVIPASLVTGLRSDVPGLVIAQVTEQVFDSPTGRVLLIPQGTRLIGTYDSIVAFGQSRALILWQRMIFPDGRSLRLDNVPATDAAGYAGLSDKVDFHTWALLKGVALSSLLGVGANISFSAESDLVQAIRESTQQNGTRAGDQLTSRSLDIQPTITIRPGTPVRLIVHRDLVLEPWN